MGRFDNVIDFFKKFKGEKKKEKVETFGKSYKGSACQNSCTDTSCSCNGNHNPEKMDGVLEFANMNELQSWVYSTTRSMYRSMSDESVAESLTQRLQNSKVIVDGKELTDLKLVAMNGGFMLQGY